MCLLLSPIWYYYTIVNDFRVSPLLIVGIVTIGDKDRNFPEDPQFAAIDDFPRYFVRSVNGASSAVWKP